MSISSADDHVTFDLGVRYLARDVLVGRAHDHAVLGRVVLVLVLDDNGGSLVLPAPAVLGREMPNGLTKNAKFEVLLKGGLNSKCQTLKERLQKIMPN